MQFHERLLEAVIRASSPVLEDSVLEFASFFGMTPIPEKSRSFDPCIVRIHL